MCFLSVLRKREQSEQYCAIEFRVKHRLKTRQLKRFRESKWAARGAKTFLCNGLVCKAFLRRFRKTPKSDVVQEKISHSENVKKCDKRCGGRSVIWTLSGLRKYSKALYMFSRTKRNGERWRGDRSSETNGQSWKLVVTTEATQWSRFLTEKNVVQRLDRWLCVTLDNRVYRD